MSEGHPHSSRMTGIIANFAAIAFGLSVAAVGTAAAANTLSNALVMKGQEALAREDYLTARRYFEQAIVADPRDARAYGDLGIVHQKTGAVDKAWRYYRTALDLEPNNISALGWSGDLDVSLGRIESATRKLRHLRAICGTCAHYRRLSERVVAYRARHASNTGSAKE